MDWPAVTADSQQWKNAKGFSCTHPIDDERMTTQIDSGWERLLDICTANTRSAGWGAQILFYCQCVALVRSVHEHGHNGDDFTSNNDSIQFQIELIPFSLCALPRNLDSVCTSIAWVWIRFNAFRRPSTSMESCECRCGRHSTCTQLNWSHSVDFGFLFSIIPHFMANS